MFPVLIKAVSDIGRYLLVPLDSDMYIGHPMQVVILIKSFIYVLMCGNYHL